MKAVEFNIMRMILLMENDYSFCEAFCDLGFSPDVRELRVTYEGHGKISFSAENALKKVYKEHIVEGDEKDIKTYNELSLPTPIQFSDTLKMAQLQKMYLPNKAEEIFNLVTPDYKDTVINDSIYGCDCIEQCIAKAEDIDLKVEMDLPDGLTEYFKALYSRMSVHEISYIQLID